MLNYKCIYTDVYNVNRYNILNNFPILFYKCESFNYQFEHYICISAHLSKFNECMYNKNSCRCMSYNFFILLVEILLLFAITKINELTCSFFQKIKCFVNSAISEYSNFFPNNLIAIVEYMSNTLTINLIFYVHTFC